MWVLVTPLKNWVYVNDPEALVSIFKRGTDFPQPVFVNGSYVPCGEPSSIVLKVY
ncbi:hypothetical protein F5Y09DRAFT_323301 [Xylaria sp. FL1042]|nr:hypothetical protein F5Y09DRAFT_323301 [Xylaria sp. FL1042]